MRAELTPRDTAFVVDVLVTWIGAVALGRYVIVLGRNDARSTLETRARFLVGALAGMFLVRGFSWLAPSNVWLAWLTFVPVSVLPLAMTLFVEGLIRRHVPPWLKWVATLAFAASFVANLVRLTPRGARASAEIGYVMLVSLLVTIAALAFVLARADRSSLSRAENGLIRVCALVAALALPLAATDFRFDLGGPMVRMGTLGALIFCYSLVRQPQENTRLVLWLKSFAALLAKALFACAIVAVALQTLRADVMIPLSVLAVAAIFAFAVWDRLRDVESTTRERELLQWLSREPPASFDACVAELRDLSLTADAKVFDGAALAAYDREAVTRVLPPDTIVRSLGRLRAMREGDARVARGADDLTDLLERNGATHVGLIAPDPLRLLVVTVPDLGAGRDVEIALAAIIRRCARPMQGTERADVR